jgi:hypothetical protein
VVVAIFAVLVPGTAACASYPPPEPLPYTSVTPADGTTIEARGFYPGGTEGIHFMIKAIPGLEVVNGRISATPALGIDGRTLSDLDQVQGFSLFKFPSETNPMPEVYESFGTLVGDVFSGWSTKPGTYYWQISATTVNYYNTVEVEGILYPEEHLYLSPIFSIVVLPRSEPPPPQPPQPSPKPPPATPTSPEHEYHSGPLCHPGYTTAHIGGKTECLHAGQSCSWRYRNQYRRYHYTCVRRGRHYRLVHR